MKYILVIIVLFFQNLHAQENCVFPLPANLQHIHSLVSNDPVPVLNSNPVSNKVLLIVFGGATVTNENWNGGQTIVAEPAGLTDAQMRQVFTMVAEDFALFGFNVTTEISRFNNAVPGNRQRAIVTPTSAWKPGVSGSAFVGSYTWGSESPCWIFNDRLANYPKYIGEIVSHELGHTVGLNHQSSWYANCTLQDSYNLGFGDTFSDTSWAPIMGNSLYRNRTTWYNGATTFGCTSFQENIATIIQTTGISLMPKSGGVLASNITAMVLPGQPDSFTINLPLRSLVTVYCRSNGNIDTRLRINNQESSYTDSLHSKIIIELPAGSHLLEVMAEGAPLYGNAGTVNLSFSYEPITITPVDTSHDIRVRPTVIDFRYDQHNIYLHTNHSNVYALYNSLGQTVKSGEYRNGNTIISIAGLPTGLYFFKTSMLTRKLFKR